MVWFPEDFDHREEAMKQNLLPGITVVGLLLTLAGSQLRAVAKEPTVDDRFRDAGSKASEAELPLLNSAAVEAGT